MKAIVRLGIPGLLIVALMAGLLSPAQSDVSIVSYQGSITGTGQTVPLTLSGQSTCSINFAGSGSGLTDVAQGSTDNGVTWTSVSGFTNATGTGSGNAGYGNVANYTTKFRVNVTGLTGTLSYYEACGPSIGSITATFSGSVTAAVSPIPLPVSVVAPTATPSGAPGGAVLTQPVTNGSPFPVTTAAPQVLPSTANGLKVDIENLASPNPFPVTCVSGCSATGAYTTPLPIASAGVNTPTTPIPVVVGFPLCYVPAGATPNVTGGNNTIIQCGSNGAQNVNVIGTVPVSLATTIPVNIASIPPVTPATTFPVSLATTVPVSFATVPPTAAPVASAGAAATAAPPVIAEITCAVPVGGTPNVTPGNSILAQCTIAGAQIVSPQATIPPQTLPATPSPQPLETSLPTLSTQMAQVGASQFQPLVSCSTYSANNTLWFKVTTATDTQIVGGVSGKIVYVCGYSVVGNGTNSGYFELSTSTTCASGFTEITAPVNYVAQSGYADEQMFAVYELPAGDALCYHSTSTGELDITVRATII
jgi:hypothetical protein